jgi:hypothetical protein
MENSRDRIIDLFRGIAIIDMIFVHFSEYFPFLVGKVLSHTDIAMEGFVLLSGFMVGRHYYEKYLGNGKRVTRRLLIRALQILLVQYVLIYTINLPLYYLVYEKIREAESLSNFLLKSMLLLNQIGIMHILPTFVPLFLISPVILYLLRKKLDFVVIWSSIFLFAIGNIYPYGLDIGEKTIFPFILWQIYFVAGCFLGRIAYAKNKIGPKNINKYLYASMLLFLSAMFIKHGKVIPPALTSKFPLNALGLLYGSSILFVAYAFILRYWDVFLKKIVLFSYYFPLFGRHSLLVFVLHVYTAKILLFINYSYSVNIYLNYLLISLSVMAIFKIIHYYETAEKRNYLPLLLSRLF